MMSRSRLARRIVTTTTALVLVSVAVAHAHDLFLKPIRYFVDENANVVVRVLNGTFSKSENSIVRTRVKDISVVSPDGRFRADTTAWSATGDTSTLRVRTGTTGTYVLGASTTPSVIALKPAEFNEYLRTDGMPDMLQARRQAKELGKGARERYSKHIKALIQVGSSRSESYGAQLGYPAELIPQSNPYALAVGGVLRVRTLVDGRPAPNQFVLYGGRLADGGRIAQRSVRSNEEGIAAIPLRARGIWYVKFIHMTRVQGDTVDYESKWASLTFQLR